MKYCCIKKSPRLHTKYNLISDSYYCRNQHGFLCLETCIDVGGTFLKTVTVTHLETLLFMFIKLHNFIAELLLDGKPLRTAPEGVPHGVVLRRSAWERKKHLKKRATQIR